MKIFNNENFLIYSMHQFLTSIDRRQDPNLWVQALSYFASIDKCKEYIAEVLRHIETNHLMPPLMVVQTLAESQHATLADIKVCVCVGVDGWVGERALYMCGYTVTHMHSYVSV